LGYREKKKKREGGKREEKLSAISGFLWPSLFSYLLGGDGEIPRNTARRRGKEKKGKKGEKS